MAGSATVGTAVIKLSFDGKDVKAELKGIDSEVKNTNSRLGSALKGTGKAMAGAFAAASGAAVALGTTLTKTAIQGFGEYEQLVGGVDTLFKDSSNQVQNYASEAYKTAQISANNYMSTVTSFSASLLQSLNGDTAKSAEIANTAIIDMADNANKMGTSMESIQYAYQGFAKQNYMMLDNLKLGYGGTRTEMQRLLKDAEKISGIHFEMDNFADIVQAIHIVQDELGIAGTSAKEASQTIQGSVAAMKSAWSNLVTGMADENANIGTLVNNFVETASTALENLVPVLLSSLEGIASLIERIVPLIVEKLPTLIQTLIPKFINVVTQIALAIVQNLPLILTTILNGFVQALPTLIKGIVEALPALIEALVNFLTDPANIGLIIEAAVQLFLGLVMAVPRILGSLISAFGTLVGNLWNGITSMFGQFAANFGNFIGGIFKGAINGVLAFIEGFVNLPIDALNGFLGIINNAFGWLGVNIGYIDRIQLPRLAEGGYADGATTAIIGEAGKEAVLPLENNTDNWAGLLASTLVDEMENEGLQSSTGGITVYMTNEINNEMDAQDIGRVLMQSIRRAA